MPVGSGMGWVVGGGGLRRGVALVGALFLWSSCVELPEDVEELVGQAKAGLEFDIKNRLQGRWLFRANHRGVDPTTKWPVLVWSEIGEDQLTSDSEEVADAVREQVFSYVTETLAGGRGEWNRDNREWVVHDWPSERRADSAAGAKDTEDDKSTQGTVRHRWQYLNREADQLAWVGILDAFAKQRKITLSTVDEKSPSEVVEWWNERFLAWLTKREKKEKEAAATEEEKASEDDRQEASYGISRVVAGVISRSVGEGSLTIDVDDRSNKDFYLVKSNDITFFDKNPFTADVRFQGLSFKGYIPKVPIAFAVLGNDSFELNNTEEVSDVPMTLVVERARPGSSPSTWSIYVFAGPDLLAELTLYRRGDWKRLTPSGTEEKQATDG